MGNINNWLGEITGFEIDESVGYEYEEYIDETNGEKMRNKKEIIGENISVKSSLSRVVNYINKKYPDFYDKIGGNTMLDISVSNNHITGTGLLCTYLFLQWKKYSIETLGEPKHLRNITFTNELANALTRNIQNGYFYINTDGIPGIVQEKKEDGYIEKLSDVATLIFGKDFLGIYGYEGDEQREEYLSVIVTYNKSNIQDGGEVISKLADWLINADKSSKK